MGVLIFRVGFSRRSSMSGLGFLGVLVLCVASCIAEPGLAGRVWSEKA